MGTGAWHNDRVDSGRDEKENPRETGTSTEVGLVTRRHDCETPTVGVTHRRGTSRDITTFPFPRSPQPESPDRPDPSSYGLVGTRGPVRVTRGPSHRSTDTGRVTPLGPNLEAYEQDEEKWVLFVCKTRRSPVRPSLSRPNRDADGSGVPGADEGTPRPRDSPL